MVNRPSVPEIITVNSEALQTQIRDLLPSQNGFGSELQATNVITPIIDLTAAAEGSGLPEYLQTALAFGSQTAFSVANSTVVLANSPGFYRIVGVMTARAVNTLEEVEISLSDGLSTKKVYSMAPDDTTSVVGFTANVDLFVWLASGESVSTTSTNNACTFKGSIRQVADSQGTLVQPNGYPL